MSKFPERLKELRKNRKISQQTLSKYLNYGYTAIANYESGRNEPSIDTLIQIAEYFDVTVDYLIGLSDFPNREKGLLKKETKLLLGYRELNDAEQNVIEELLEILSKSNK